MQLFQGTRFRNVLVATAALVCCSLGAAHEARATLGGDEASVATNEHALAAARQVRKLAVGERHDLTLPSGIVVHEYLSPSGAVYAVTWRGPLRPDLRELLGPYFGQLSNRAPGSHHRLDFTGVDLRVQSMGHRHASSGRAWVPSLVPAGVTIDASLD
jgi:hypothetical protein